MSRVIYGTRVSLEVGIIGTVISTIIGVVVGMLAGFYPKPLTAATHDGLWYWTQARQLEKGQQPWNAWRLAMWPR